MKGIRSQHGWVVVCPNRLYEFTAFADAFAWQLDHLGHLMTKQYYNTQWLPERVLNNIDEREN